MKAATYYGPGDMRYEEVKDPKAGPEGAVVRIASSGVCNVMDLDAWGRWTNAGEGVGLARGHEWSGEIVELGSKVTDFKVGDKVFQNPVYKPCHRCEYCKEGDYWRCVNWQDGLSQRAIHGANAEYLWIPFITNESAAKFDGSMKLRDLAMIEPLYLAIGLSRKAKPGEVVLVLGQDLMGLGTVAKLKERGCKVISTDLSTTRLKASKELGADVVIDVLNEDVVQVVMKETMGKGADVVILIDQRPIALAQAMSAVRRAGKIWLATYYYSPYVVGSGLKQSTGKAHGRISRWIGPGSSYTEPDVGFDPVLMHVQSAWGTLGPRVPRWLEAAEMIKSGQFTADKYVTHVFPLNETAEAYETAENNLEAIKVVVEP